MSWNQMSEQERRELAKRREFIKVAEGNDLGDDFTYKKHELSDAIKRLMIDIADVKWEFMQKYGREPTLLMMDRSKYELLQKSAEAKLLVSTVNGSDEPTHFSNMRIVVETSYEDRLYVGHC